VIGLCDMRSFYASCEKVFRPDLRGASVVVLSNNDGVIVACDPESKAAGIKKFEPYFKQLELIEQAGIHAFSSNYELYGEISSRIMDTLAALAPNDIEIYSIDECFIDFGGVPPEQLKPLGRSFRDAIWQEQRIRMGVSIGPTKTLAKLGQYATKVLPKIEGVCVLEHEHQWQWLAERVAVSEVWGVGRRLTQKLKAMGITTAAGLAAMSEANARALQGITLVRTIQELNGEAVIDMELEPPPKQQIISSRSFGQKQTHLQSLQEAASNHAARAGEKLRAQSSVCYRLSAWAETSRFETNRYSDDLCMSFPGGTADSRTLSRAAADVMARVFRQGLRYAKVGVVLHDIRAASFSQRDLLIPENRASGQVMQLMDGLNKRFGSGSVKLARQAGATRFAMRRELKSPNYLNSWHDLPRIRVN